MWNMAGCSYNKLGIFLFLHKWVLGNSLVEKLCSPELRNSVKDTGEQMPSLLNLFNEDTRFPFFTSVGIWGRSINDSAQPQGLRHWTLEGNKG